MANTRLVFMGSGATKCAEVEVNEQSGLIQLYLITAEGFNAEILLDVPTAVKFSKTLRHEISKAKEAINE